MNRRAILVCSVLLPPTLLLPNPISAQGKNAPVDFVRDIKPIFAQHCVSCHGRKEQLSGLRLDFGKLVLAGGDRGATLIAGKSQDSLLVRAIEGRGEVTAMPEEGPRLSKVQIALIRKWIDQGAKIPRSEDVGVGSKSDHWSFQPIAEDSPPPVRDRAWVRNPIDAFVLARLESEGIRPSGAASRSTLIRRVYFDLLGIAPSLSDVAAFQADTVPGAYNRMVDRVLASPHYGERWARHWLDIARYADSNGFTIDGPRQIWKYRDWVINAFNRDISFADFATEQLAGDLLPNATRDQIIATGFHRNTLINEEGGTDQEQFRVEAVNDRVATTGTTFLGLTLGCAQCHSHKFDPISQREYYQFFAIFNNQDEPTISVPTVQQTERVKQLDTAVAAAEKPLTEFDAQLLKGMPAWEERLAKSAGTKIQWQVLVAESLKTEKGAVLAKQDDDSIFVDFSIPPRDTFIVGATAKLSKITAIRLEALTHNSLPKKGPGRAPNGNFVLNEFECAVADASGKESPVKFAGAVADHSQEGFEVGAAIDGKTDTGWAINVKKGSLNVDREAVFFPDHPITTPSATSPSTTPATTPSAKLTIRLRHLSKGDNYLLGRFRLSVTQTPPEVLSVPAKIRELAAIKKDKRTKDQQAQLVNFYKSTAGERRPLAEKVATLKKQRTELGKQIPLTMVLKERAKPRQTHIHIRGDFLRKGAVVEPAVPTVLHSLPAGSKLNRREFSKWLLDPKNPLTARVTVNRFWQRFFGRGLVGTENDFGTQGARPTHPKLLDWMARDFIRQGWGIKSMHRLILTSATYRQSSSSRPELQLRDPKNLLLSRQNRLRLEAEVIRDVALYTSGKLATKFHGPGVYPPQPDGIYVLTQVKKSWPESKAEDRYRRGIYTYLWRSSIYPMMPTFDAPDANRSCSRRSRSNTPLQALTLANDRAFLEMAQALGLRLMQEGSAADDGRIRHAYRICFSRDPSEIELKVLNEYVASQREAFSASVADAKSVTAGLTFSAPPAETATWVSLARVLMNLDEFITRE